MWWRQEELWGGGREGKSSGQGHFQWRYVMTLLVRLHSPLLHLELRACVCA